MDVVSNIKIVIECTEVAEALRLHRRGNVGIDDGEWFVLSAVVP